MTIFKNIGVVYKPKAEIDTLKTAFNSLINVLKKNGINHCHLYQKIPSFINPKDIKKVNKKDFANAIDLLVVLGGDGTLLSSVRILGINTTPILGVNLGSLGFLTEIPIEEFEHALQDTLIGKHKTDDRLLLKGVIKDDKNKVIAIEHVLNDVVVTKGALARIMDIHLKIDGKFVSDYKSDGLIISTPTGSTAYSLAAGGPIIFPNTDVLTITPICPHSLTNRPIVLDSSSVIEISLLKPHDSIFITFDGQKGYKFLPAYKLEVVKSNHKCVLIKPTTKFYFDVLKEKLKWGER